MEIVISKKLSGSILNPNNVLLIYGLMFLNPPIENWGFNLITSLASLVSCRRILISCKLCEGFICSIFSTPRLELASLARS